MPRPKSKLNEATSEVIEENILKENPEGLPEIKEPSIVQVVQNLPRMETIIFRNDRDPGMPLEFHYHTKTHPLGRYKLFHGKQYTLPTEVVEHLEGSSIPIYSYRKGPDGHPEMFVSSFKYNFSCKPVRNAA